MHPPRPATYTVLVQVLRVRHLRPATRPSPPPPLLTLHRHHHHHHRAPLTCTTTTGPCPSTQLPWPYAAWHISSSSTAARRHCASPSTAGREKSLETMTARARVAATMLRAAGSSGLHTRRGSSRRVRVTSRSDRRSRRACESRRRSHSSGLTSQAILLIQRSTNRGACAAQLAPHSHKQPPSHFADLPWRNTNCTPCRASCSPSNGWHTVDGGWHLWGGVWLLPCAALVLALVLPLAMARGSTPPTPQQAGLPPAALHPKLPCTPAPPPHPTTPSPPHQGYGLPHDALHLQLLALHRGRAGSHAMGRTRSGRAGNDRPMPMPIKVPARHWPRNTPVSRWLPLRLRLPPLCRPHTAAAGREHRLVPMGGSRYLCAVPIQRFFNKGHKQTRQSSTAGTSAHMPAPATAPSAAG